MLASDLIKLIQGEINKYGDLPILHRDCENGFDYDRCTVHSDPASEWEKEEGICGTIDINLF
jgi:hypothetical protein